MDCVYTKNRCWRLKKSCDLSLSRHSWGGGCGGVPALYEEQISLVSQYRDDLETIQKDLPLGRQR